MMTKKVKVMFVCMGNICRSPTAHAVFRDLVRKDNLEDKIEVASSGTHAYHVGEPADGRSQQVASQRGVEMSDLRAQKIIQTDLNEYDYVLTMDRSNHDIVLGMADENQRQKVKLFMGYASDDWRTSEVPDPYYEGKFEEVFDMISDASENLLAEIKATL